MDFFATYVQAVLSMTNCKIISISKNKPKGLFKSIYKNKNIRFIKMDLNDNKKFKMIMKQKFDFIFHCATYGQPKKWVNNEWATINLNINSLKFILENSVKYRSKVLFVSSASVYKLQKKNEILVETSQLGTGSFFNETIYATSKILAEKLCEYYRVKYNIPVYIVRPAHTYGPGQDFKDPRVVPQLLKRAIIEKKIYMYDSGKTVRTWCYISDLTIIMLLNIAQNGKQLIYNVSGNEYKSIYQIAKLICKYQKIKKVEFRNKKLKFTNPNYDILILSSKKYNTEFPKLKYTNFNVGIKKTIEWNKLNGKNKIS